MMRRLMTACAAIVMAMVATASHSAAPPHAGGNVLFWSQAERQANLSRMEKIFPTQMVKARRNPSAPVAARKQLDVTINAAGGTMTIGQFMRDSNMAGVLALKDGKIRLERYALGLTREGHWSSFSVAKSLTSTLVGVAIRDGKIGSVNDPVTRYIPGLRGSAFEGVTLHHLLTMSSGVKWNEDYSDPNSDAAKLKSFGESASFDVVSYMAQLPRVSEPGQTFHYNTGNTHLLGIAVSNAAGMPLSQYLSERIWKPFGMQHHAYWVTSHGQVLGGSYLNASLRDFGLFGQFMLAGGKIGSRSVIPDGWFEQAARPAYRIRPGLSYGYQWWINDDATVQAIGIYGQTIYLNRAKKLVVVVLSAWDKPVEMSYLARQRELIHAIESALDQDQR